MAPFYSPRCEARRARASPGPEDCRGIGIFSFGCELPDPDSVGVVVDVDEVVVDSGFCAPAVVEVVLGAAVEKVLGPRGRCGTSCRKCRRKKKRRPACLKSQSGNR